MANWRPKVASSLFRAICLLIRGSVVFPKWAKCWYISNILFQVTRPCSGLRYQSTFSREKDVLFFFVCSHYPWFEKTEGDCLGEVNFLWKLKRLTSYFLFLHKKLSHSATEQYNHVRQINHAISSEYPKTVTKAVTQWMQFMQLREEAWKNR